MFVQGVGQLNLVALVISMLSALSLLFVKIQLQGGARGLFPAWQHLAVSVVPEYTHLKL